MSADSGELFYGQLYDRENNIVIRFTEQVRPEETADTEDLGDNNKEISPIDGHSAKVRTYSVPTAELNAFLFETPGTANLRLPDEVTGITVTFNSSTGNGEDLHEVGAVAWVGDSGGMTMTPQSQANASAQITPQVSVSRKRAWNENVPTRRLLFFLVNTKPTRAEVLAKATTAVQRTGVIVAGLVTTTEAHQMIAGQPFTFTTLSNFSGGVAVSTTYYVLTTPIATTFTYAATVDGVALVGHAATGCTVAPTVSDTPMYAPEEITLSAVGRSISVQQSADSRMQYAWSSDGSVSYNISPWMGSKSGGVNRQVGTTVETIVIPHSIHGELTISPYIVGATCMVSVKANIPAVTGADGAPSVQAVTNEPPPISETIFASVTPFEIAATAGQSTLPARGLYVHNLVVEKSAWGASQCMVELVNHGHLFG